MDFYNLILENKELIKIFYALIIVLVCAIIVIKTDKLFRLSSHNGIRYLRNAFFFYGLGFISRYFFGLFSEYKFLALILFKYFFVMAGFFLLYSLLWKNMEENRKKYASSLFNFNLLIFYVMGLIIVLLDSLWKPGFILFASQITLFFLITIIACANWINKGASRKFLKFYFLAMIFSFTAWILNALAALLLDWNQGVLILVYLLNTIIFLLFLCGVIKVTTIK